MTPFLCFALVRFLALKWSLDIIGALNSSQSVYATTEFDNLMESLIALGKKVLLCLSCCLDTNITTYFHIRNTCSPMYMYTQTIDSVLFCRLQDGRTA